MMTAMLTAKNILAGERKYDVWAVNQDAEYHESGAAGEQAAPKKLAVPLEKPPRLTVKIKALKSEPVVEPQPDAMARDWIDSA